MSGPDRTNGQSLITELRQSELLTPTIISFMIDDTFGLVLHRFLGRKVADLRAGGAARCPTIV